MKAAMFYAFWSIVGVVAWMYGDQIKAWEHSHAYLMAWIVGVVVIGWVFYVIESTTRQIGIQIDGLAARIQALEDQIGINNRDY